MDDRDGDRFERRLDIANVPVPRLETILCDRGYIERVSRSDYTHEENPFLIRSVVFVGGGTWMTIVSSAERRFLSRIEFGSFYSTIVLYRIILCEKYTRE